MSALAQAATSRNPASVGQVISLNNLADLYTKLGKTEEAKQFADRAA
jgi:hypothetical protein